jgi:hypothetical protein
VSVVGHNLLNFIAVPKRWEIFYEDVSAAFLQGGQLPEGREIYVKIPYLTNLCTSFERSLVLNAVMIWSN